MRPSSDGGLPVGGYFWYETTNFRGSCGFPGCGPRCHAGTQRRYDLGCCTATLGYDTASGRGSVDFTVLTRLLLS